MNVIKKVANEHNISSYQIRHEMESAINIASSNSSKNEMWSKLFPNGQTPTPEEFIATISKFIRENYNV